MIEGGLVDICRARELFSEAEPLLFRSPAIDPAALRDKVDRTLGA